MSSASITAPPAGQARCFNTMSELRQAAGASMAEDVGEDMFFTPAWFENLATHGIDSACKPQWLLVHGEPGELVCVPLLWLPKSAAAAYGGTTGALANYYSSLYAPISQRPPSLIACRIIANWMRRLPMRAGVLNLHPLDTDSAFAKHLRQALSEAGWWVDDYFCFGNWHLEVNGRRFDDYYPTVPSRIRNTIRRGRKKLDDSGTWSLHIHKDPGDALETAISDFDAIYRQSWKVPEPFPSFVPGLCRTAARLGWLRLGVVRIGDVPIAAQLWLTRHRKAQIYKLAYDEAYKRFSAGSILSAEMMRFAFDVDLVHDVDYLTGDDDYKADWMSQRRVRKGVIAFDRRSVQGTLSSFTHHLRRWLRMHLPRKESGPARSESAGRSTAEAKS